MSTRTIKSSFFVRKSSRLSTKKIKDDKSTNGPEQSNVECDHEQPKKATTMTAALRNVFHKKDRRREEGVQSSRACENRTQEKPNKQSPKLSVSPTSMAYAVSTCCSAAQSPKSASLLRSSPVSVPSEPSTPVKTHSPLSVEELNHACRRLLSPSKRKSDDENEFVQCSVSPVKSARSSPGGVSLTKPVTSPQPTPGASDKEDQRTPKSCNKHSGNRLARVPTSTPRRLFSSPEKKSGEVTPKKQMSSGLLTPNNSPCTPLYKQNSKPYQSAKRCLHTAKPDRLIGRDRESQWLEDYISERLEDRLSGSLYVSGPPGTGKTAVITHVVDNLKSKFPGMKSATINCMTLKDAGSVFSHLHQQLKGSPIKVKDAMKAMEKLFTSCSHSVLLVLDEIDQLDSKHHDVLYRIFEWPALRQSRLVLVGIANALDLTDRVLPRLQASVTCRPTLMNFAPYTSVQITDILKHRLERENVVEPSAINFCARKVSAVAGDMRKALDVCRRAVEMVEADVRTQTVLKPQDCNSPTKRQMSGAENTPMKKVTLAHISRVMNDVYGGKLQTPSVTAADAGGDSGLPLQQTLAVCSLLLLLKSARVKDVLLGKLHDCYARVCRKQQVAPVDQVEFLSLLSLLDSRGIVALKKAKDTRFIKVTLKLDEQDLEATLRDKTLIANILKDGPPK